MRKIIPFSIFTIAGLTALLTLFFGFGFNQNSSDKFQQIVQIKKSNSQLLIDLENETLETLPSFIIKYEEDLIARNVALKKQKVQRDIFYTFLYHLGDVTNRDTYEKFKAKFPEYSKSMFVLAENKDYFIKGFLKTSSFSDFQSYYKKLKNDYAVVRSYYCAKEDALKAETNLLKQVHNIHAAVSFTKKQYDLLELQKNIQSCRAGAFQFNITMNLVYILFFATILSMVVFLLLSIFGNIKSSLGILLGFGVLLLLLVIGYIISSSELSPVAIKLQETPSTVRWVGAGLFTFYCVFFGALATVFFTLAHSIIKNRK